MPLDIYNYICYNILEVIIIKKCEISGCNNNAYTNICWRHYYHMRRHGKILERTIYDDNEIIRYDNYAEIILYNKQCEEVTRTKIDLDDIDKCCKYKWRLHNAGYAYGRLRKSKKSILLHRVIMNIYDNNEIDHINHDILDNRKSNLRICNSQQNRFNRKFKSNSTSGIKGICWDKSNLKWEVKIGKDNKTIHLGRFINIKDAVRIRIKKELELFGEYANIYEIGEILNKYYISMWEVEPLTEQTRAHLINRLGEFSEK